MPERVFLRWRSRGALCGAVSNPPVRWQGPSAPFFRPLGMAVAPQTARPPSLMKQRLRTRTRSTYACPASTCCKRTCLPRGADETPDLNYLRLLPHCWSKREEGKESLTPGVFALVNPRATAMTALGVGHKSGEVDVAWRARMCTLCPKANLES